MGRFKGQLSGLLWPGLALRVLVELRAPFLWLLNLLYPRCPCQPPLLLSPCSGHFVEWLRSPCCSPSGLCAQGWKLVELPRSPTGPHFATAASVSRSVIMPKSLAKSKHGRKHSSAPQRQSGDESASFQDPAQSLVAPSSHAHHKSRKHGSALERVEKRRDRVLTQICAKASSDLQSSTTSAPLQSSRPATPDQLSLRDCPVTISTSNLWGSVPADLVTAPPADEEIPDIPLPLDTSAVPSVPVLPQEAVSCPLSSDQLQKMIEAAVQKTLAAGRRPSSVAGSVRSASPEQPHSSGHAPPRPPRSPSCSHAGQLSSLSDEDISDNSDSGLSDDENLPPDQPASTALFPQALFRSLLFKAVNTARLSSTDSNPSVSGPSGTLDPMFAEPPKPITTIPTPPLFLDVVKRQWTSPASAPIPSSSDRTNFQVASDMDTLLQLPSIDAPIAALLSSAAVPGDPAENLRPDERRADMVLQRAHLGAAWAIKAASTASFFNRSTLLWLRQLQEKLSPEEARIKHDLNKIVAAIQFSADSTLSAARFAAKSLASAVTARRLTWLRHWQADARHKWKLASVPFGGSRLFGDALDPFLTETRDKRKVLAAAFRRGDSRFSPYPPRSHLRGNPVGGPSSSSFPSPRPYANFGRQRGSQDRGFRGRSLGSKRPFRGGGGRFIRRRR